MAQRSGKIYVGYTQHGIRISKEHPTLFAVVFLLATRGKASTLAQSEGREVAIIAMLASVGREVVRSHFSAILFTYFVPCTVYSMPFYVSCSLCSVPFSGPCLLCSVPLMFHALDSPCPFEQNFPANASLV
jgi:hypothetical protein